MILLVLKFHHIPRKLNVPLTGLLFEELTDSTYQVLHSFNYYKEDRKKNFFSLWCHVETLNWVYNVSVRTLKSS